MITAFRTDPGHPSRRSVSAPDHSLTHSFTHSFIRSPSLPPSLPISPSAGWWEERGRGGRNISQEDVGEVKECERVQECARFQPRGDQMEIGSTLQHQVGQRVGLPGLAVVSSSFWEGSALKLSRFRVLHTS